MAGISGLSSPRRAIRIPTEGDAGRAPAPVRSRHELGAPLGRLGHRRRAARRGAVELARADHLPAPAWQLAILLTFFTLPLAYRQRAPLAVAVAMIGVLAIGGIISSPSDGPLELFLALILLFVFDRRARRRPPDGGHRGGRARGCGPGHGYQRAPRPTSRFLGDLRSAPGCWGRESAPPPSARRRAAREPTRARARAPRPRSARGSPASCTTSSRTA